MTFISRHPVSPQNASGPRIRGRSCRISSRFSINLDLREENSTTNATCTSQRCGHSEYCDRIRGSHHHHFGIQRAEFTKYPLHVICLIHDERFEKLIDRPRFARFPGNGTKSTGSKSTSPTRRLGDKPSTGKADDQTDKVFLGTRSHPLRLAGRAVGRHTFEGGLLGRHQNTSKYPS